MQKKKLTTGLLTGMLIVSTLGLSMMTGCGLLSSDTAKELAQQILEKEEGNGAEEQTAAAESIEHSSNFRRTDDFGETDVASAGDAETDENSIRFTTVDLDGSPVSGSIFQDADLTLVYVWATYCGPCIMSMPDYEELYENLPDNVNLIGLVSDVYEGDAQGVQAAKDILDETGAKFKSICVSDTVEPLISNMQFTPSSFIVDRQGHMVGEFMDGSSFSDSVERLSELLE